MGAKKKSLSGAVLLMATAIWSLSNDIEHSIQAYLRGLVVGLSDPQYRTEIRSEGLARSVLWINFFFLVLRIRLLSCRSDANHSRLTLGSASSPELQKQTRASHLSTLLPSWKLDFFFILTIHRLCIENTSFHLVRSHSNIFSARLLTPSNMSLETLSTELKQIILGFLDLVSLINIRNTNRVLRDTVNDAGSIERYPSSTRQASTTLPRSLSLPLISRFSKTYRTSY
jgi:hypothetical protein